ncbi:hypothetical protein LF41_2387 [Lysobacter dokdonensis DS-58]|uniref:Uncharacterized protein n=1 Tax=Lysobacter dokdonensis DS-58 TaxID=1300345 RepID=A0A0A2WNL0_9GAMM|nr:hypothetical protein [Lysobacter dokdonensis]KGQ19880.1 hypothetical protein LF41_2387 [Lysobacter dokdonensis DS-58]
MTAFNDESLFAWVYALTRVEPGDFATAHPERPEHILARNHACTPPEVWHTNYGVEL